MFEKQDAGFQNPTMSKDQRTLLVIDDDSADRAIYKRFLSSQSAHRNYLIYEAKTGKEGLNLFDEVDPDCVILDYMLPDANGLDILKNISERYPFAAVVALTGQGDENIAVDIMKAGAQDYLSKNTLTETALTRAVDNAIEKTTLFERIATQNEALKKAQKIVENEKQKAIKADKAKSEFLATMSHEIRTPMNGIIGMAELLFYTSLDEKQELYANSIRSSGELLLGIINNILDFSKIEAEELKLESKPIALDRLLSDVIQLLDSRAHENRVELILRWPYDELIPTIKADPTRLQQILINLIGNAIKFTRDGQIVVKAIKKNQSADRVCMRLEVQDTGVGIPEDKIDHIFGQFTQADSSTTREYGGTGLGLTICKKLVEIMGGTIGVESEPGKGSTFWFEISFPVADELDQIAFQTSHKNDLQSKRVLIVDDYPENVELFSEYLKESGIETHGVISALEGLEELRRAQEKSMPYHVVLTDHSMPKMDGETFNCKITENPQIYGNPKRILVTGLGKRKSFSASGPSGFSAHLLKPVNPDKLIECIMQVLAGQKDQAQDHDDDESSMSESLPQIGAHVLVVEDDRVSQRMAKSVLNELGCTFNFAGHGEEALDILKEKHADYDIIFMDWQMPVMDGHEAIRKIREQEWGKDLKIIALTANAIEGDKEKCLEVGANDYMSKPVRVLDVVQTLRKHLSRDVVKAA